MENVDNFDQSDVNDEQLDRPLLIVKKAKKLDAHFLTPRQGDTGRK
jgi:hypothetical protein